MSKYYKILTILFSFALFLASSQVYAASFDQSQTSLTSDSSSATNIAYSTAQNTNTNAYTTTSNLQNPQQSINSPSAININTYPQETSVNVNYPRNTEQSIPSVPFSGNQGFTIKERGNKGSLTYGREEYSKITQKDLGITAPDMSFLGKNLIRAPEDKPKRETDEGYFPGPSYNADDIAKHYLKRKEENVSYIYDQNTYR
jgi:hypothetical protein